MGKAYCIQVSPGLSLWNTPNVFYPSGRGAIRLELRKSVEWVWWCWGVADEAHTAEMLVAGTVEPRARANPKKSIGGQRWWVIDRSYFCLSEDVGVEKFSIAMRYWGNTPRLSNLMLAIPVYLLWNFQLQNALSVHFSQSNLSFAKGVVLCCTVSGVFTSGSDQILESAGM